MSIRLSFCHKRQLIESSFAAFPSFIVNGLRHLLLRLVGCHCWPLWPKSASRDKALQKGADLWDHAWSKSTAQDKGLRQGADLWGHCGRSLLHETEKSSDKGQISETHHGQSPLRKTKFSNKGQIPEAYCGWTLLHERKTSDEREISETLRGWSPVRNKVLRGGAGCRILPLLMSAPCSNVLDHIYEGDF